MKKLLLVFCLLLSSASARPGDLTVVHDIIIDRLPPEKHPNVYSFLWYLRGRIFWP